MSEMEDPANGELSQFTDWDIFIPLVSDNADKAGFRIKNNPAGEPHRVHITGFDRNTTAIRGRLFHVVHGTVGSGDLTPATLVVFEWSFFPGRLGHRFREVQIDVTFRACGSRRGKQPGDDLSLDTPEVISVAPDAHRSCISEGLITTETEFKAGLNLSQSPLAAASLEKSQKVSEAKTRTHYRSITGYPYFMNSDWGKPDGVHWTMLENASQQSGMLHKVRTAVILHRRAGDYGMFSANVKTSAHVSFLNDAAEAIRKAVGLVPHDDPLFFDPESAKDTEHGAAVLYGNKNTRNIQSPVDKDNLGAVDLNEFLIEDKEIIKWRENESPLTAGDNQGANTSSVNDQ
ncbi:hypothetical protein GGR50DRAFT_522511 [Xylaria sp. CBS 124048]|nr:hypothetical protein GGR50DRAFT_522511 [Xylaria sp. CBS 124048]